MPQSNCTNDRFACTVAHVLEYLNTLVHEIRWNDRLSQYNHHSQFLRFVTDCTDGIPRCTARVHCQMFYETSNMLAMIITVSADNLGT